jgi:hypothetical protein
VRRRQLTATWSIGVPVLIAMYSRAWSHSTWILRTSSSRGPGVSHLRPRSLLVVKDHFLGGDPDGGALIFKSQTCSWDSPVGAESPQGGDGSAAAPVQPPAAVPAPGSIDSVPSPTTVSPPTGNGHQIPPDADTQGFVGYPGAQCNHTNPAVTIGRTADSAVVICKTGVGRFYYKGFGLQNWSVGRDRRPGADGIRFRRNE